MTCKHCDAGFCNGPMDDSCGEYVEPKEYFCPICGQEVEQEIFEEFGGHIKCALDQ